MNLVVIEFAHIHPLLMLLLSEPLMLDFVFDEIVESEDVPSVVRLRLHLAICSCLQARLREVDSLQAAKLRLRRASTLGAAITRHCLWAACNGVQVHTVISTTDRIMALNASRRRGIDHSITPGAVVLRREVIGHDTAGLVFNLRGKEYVEVWLGQITRHEKRGVTVSVLEAAKFEPRFLHVRKNIPGFLISSKAHGQVGAGSDISISPNRRCLVGAERADGIHCATVASAHHLGRG